MEATGQGQSKEARGPASPEGSVVSLVESRERQSVIHGDSDMLSGCLSWRMWHGVRGGSSIAVPFLVSSLLSSPLTLSPQRPGLSDFSFFASLFLSRSRYLLLHLCSVAELRKNGE